MNDWTFKTFQPASFVPPARPVTRVFLHCDDWDNDAFPGVQLAQEINRWHCGQGWAGIGYHFVVDRAGQVVTARSLEMTPAAQLGPDGRGNIATIAICTHGSWRFSTESLVATRELCTTIDAAYRAIGKPVTFHGHKEIDPKPCPVYGYRGLLGLDAKGVLGADHVVPPEIVAQVARHIDTSAKPPAPAVRLLKMGDEGADVAQLETKLGLPGNGCFDAVVDGLVRAQQQRHHLAVDGIVGPNTRAALGL